MCVCLHTRLCVTLHVGELEQKKPPGKPASLGISQLSWALSGDLGVRMSLYSHQALQIYSRSFPCSRLESVFIRSAFKSRSVKANYVPQYFLVAGRECIFACGPFRAINM